MTAPAKALAAALPDVRTGVRLTRVGADGNGWSAETADGEQLSAAAVVLTPPVPQSLTLLDDGGAELADDARTQLAEIVYDPCVAVMIGLDGASPLDGAGTRVWADDVLDRVTDNHRKGVSDLPCLTVHLGPDASRGWWESSDEEVVERTLTRLGELGWTLGVTGTSIQRWRYAKPTVIHPDECLHLTEPAPLVFAGDAFGGPLVEGAFRSGLAAARTLLGN